MSRCHSATQAEVVKSRRSRRGRRLTKLFEHFVALIQNEVLDTLCVETLVPSECVQTARGGDDDMGALGGLEEFLILLNGSSAIEDDSADIGHVLGESEVLVADLEGEFAGVAEYDDGDPVFCWVELLEGGEDEDCGLSMTRFGLTEDVHAKDRLWDALLLDWRGGKQENRDQDGLILNIENTNPLRDARSRGLRWLAAALASTGNPYQIFFLVSSTAVISRKAGS